ncbi:c-type cytochrome, methanol metabolism-related [Hyphomicrobium sp. 99]|uniref:c-type cytochrome, methanol metabolism-related n=1 Tax=Hyphomicrobium sp. 99 TaxID=1163419 RepID=UPI001FDA0946|nr:c-type cytochrome, methanol metabolism-related [Hyphomicrobium sp. 99]
MNKFSKRMAVALMACAAAGAAACQEQNKPAEKSAASTSAPAPEAKSEAAAPAAEPAKAASTPAPAPAAEPEKKAEAPAAPAPAAAQPQQVAQAEAPAAPAAPAASSAAPNPDDANAPPPGSRKPDGDAVYPNPVSDLAKSEGIKFEDGRYRNKDGDPVPVVTKDYMVDWGTWNGFRRYHDACHVCHGPNALGSTFAPALADSLKTMDYNTFIATVSSGRVVNRAGTEYVMPAFGEDKNIMCYIDDIYTYIKARSQNATDSKTGMPAGRPNGREDISPEAKKSAEECTG